MQRRSPRARAGFRMFAASMAEPPAAPVPKREWISSMKRRTRPSAISTSLSTAFSRSSNSPRIDVPATSCVRSSANSCVPWRPLGTSPRMMRWARPSAMAVFPTPGSPTSTGLFFFFRESTWITRRISPSRPMTGSSLPASASMTKSFANFCSAKKVFSAVGESIGLLPMRWCSSSLRPAGSVGNEAAESTAAIFLLVATTPNSRCGTARKESPRSPRQSSAASIASFVAVDHGALDGRGFCDGKACACFSIAWRTLDTSVVKRCKILMPKSETPWSRKRACAMWPGAVTA